MIRPLAYLWINLKSNSRFLHVSTQHCNKSYTKEAKPIPGTDDYKNPLGWAKRLFQMQEAKPQNSANEPPLLYMVCRLKPLKGIIHYQRAILEKYGLGIDTKNHTWVIVKNTPSVNRELYEVKHLVRIQPVVFVNGLPTEADLLTCRLLPDGRFFRHRGLAVDSKLSGSSESSQTSVSICDANKSDVPKLLSISGSGKNNYLSRKYLKQWHNNKWSNFTFFKEFFTSHYRYKLNQDGNEYRYSGLWRLDKSMLQSVQSRRNPDGTFKQPNSNRFDADWNTYPWSK
ncbi:unnamed protein product [Heterobilharzia americana]|nr:unnamed protein product [Heterobilharzia americana]CAH8519098.1 unnamed protein product [Heterobilharzia americana]